MKRLINAYACMEQMKNMSVEYDAKTVQRCIEIVSNAPTIDAELVRHGKWKDIRCGIGTCSECGNRYGSVDVMNYCPACGARMDEDD